MAKARKCIFCGKSYEYCNHCLNSSKYPSWMFNFDTKKCHDLYDVMAGYGMGIKTVEDVKKVIKEYEVTDYSIFPKELQDKLNEVPSQEKEEPKVEKKEENPKKDNNFKPRDMKKNNNKFNFERRANTEE